MEIGKIENIVVVKNFDLTPQSVIGKLVLTKEGYEIISKNAKELIMTAMIEKIDDKIYIKAISLHQKPYFNEDNS